MNEILLLESLKSLFKLEISNEFNSKINYEINIKLKNGKNAKILIEKII